MRRIIALVLVAHTLLWCVPTLSAQDSASTPRKVLVKVTPAYPELARKMQLSGTVRMGVTVAPNGTVKKTEVRGGSPLLVQAAQTAVNKWKWAPAPEETTEILEINFHPQ
jgi:TonB family protein